MQRLFRFGAPLLSLGLVLPLLAADGDKPPEDPKVRSKLLQGDVLTGKLTQIDADGDEKKFVLEVSQKAWVVNAPLKAKYDDLNTQYKKAVQANDRNQANNLANQMKDVYSKMYEKGDVGYEFSLLGDKELPIRRQELPPKEGEDGKPGKYTAEELKKLKGDDPKLPYYAAEVKDLEKDMVVKVYLDKSKIKAPATGKDKDKEKKKDEAEEIPVYPIKMIVIPPLPKGSLPGLVENPNAPAPVEIKEDPRVRAKMLDKEYLEGKLSKADVEDAKGLVLDVPYSVKTVNAAQAKRAQDIYAQAQKSKDANEIANLKKQYDDAMSKYYDVTVVPYSFPLETSKETTKYRVMQLPPKEGEDGKPGKYTPEELKKLKGDDAKAIGYTAEPKDLSTDVIVRVYLDKSKLKKPAKPKAGEEPAEEISSYPVLTIVIMPPPKEAGLPGMVGGPGGVEITVAGPDGKPIKLPPLVLPKK